MAPLPTAPDTTSARPSTARSDLASARAHWRASWVGMDHASIMAVELMAAFLTWGGIGWLVDRWLGTDPWGIAIGSMIGMAAGLYLIYLRSGRMEGFDGRDTAEAGRRGGAADGG